MKTTCTLIALLLAASLAVAGEDSKTIVGKFIRKTGQYSLDDRGSTLTITEDSPAKWSLKIVWQAAPNLRLNDSPDALRSTGWFVYVESRDRLWIYDGEKHLIFEGHENQKGLDKIVGGMTPKIWATCPKEVLEALPEKARGKKKPNQGAAANRRPAGQSAFAALRRDESDGSGSLSAPTSHVGVAADRAFPAAVAELGR